MPVPALFLPPVRQRADASDANAEPVLAPSSAGPESRCDALLPLVRACLRERTLMRPADDARDELPRAS